nr:MAG TPA: hypothetical protein [Caudoviricetes sp.]
MYFNTVVLNLVFLTLCLVILFFKCIVASILSNHRFCKSY